MDYKIIWEEVKEKEKIRNLFKLDREMIKFIENSSIYSVIELRSEIKYKIKIKTFDGIYEFTRDGFTLSMPSNGFVQYGTRIGKMYPLLNELVKKIKESKK